MNPKLKAGLLILGPIAAILLVSQFAMGLMIANGGGSPGVVKIIKAHLHSGYLTVTISLLYVALSLVAVARTPGRG